MSAEIKSYDRIENETIKAYAAFCIYRDMGIDRTIVEVTKQTYKQSPQATHTRPTGISRVLDWSSKYNWVDRCKDYDRDEEAIARERNRELDRAEHDAKLEKFRHDNEELGSEMIGLSSDLTSFFRTSLAETVQVFKSLVNDPENAEQEVKLVKAKQSQLGHLFTVSQICKSATAFATVGGDLTADGLLIRQMLEKLKESGD